MLAVDYSNSVVVNVIESLIVYPHHVGLYRQVYETLSLANFSATIGISVNEVLEATGSTSVDVSIYISETLTYEVLPKDFTISVTVTEELTYQRLDIEARIYVYESLVIHYNATPTGTPTITPPPPTQTYAPPTHTPPSTATPPLFRDLLAMCSKVTEYEDLGNGLRLYQTSGNPVIEIDPKVSGSVAIQPHSSVATLYQYICSNYWFCGFRVYVLVNCYGGLCAVSLNSLGANSNIPDSVSLRVFGDLARMRVSIRAKEESSFGFGALVWYLVLEYTMNDGYEAEVETPIWSWAFSVSSEHKEPYPIQIYSRNYYDVYDCSKLEMSRCPWRGAWHSTVSCAIYEFFRFMWNMIYSILPQPVKDFLTLIYAFLSGVTSVLSLALNPTFITMFTILIFSVFALFLVYLLLEKGPIGIIEFFATVKEFVGSVVDWILKLINTLKP